MILKVKVWQWIVLCVFAYLLFLIAYIPATYVADFVQKQSQGQVRLSNVTGTLFEGNASIIEANGFQVNNLDWTLNPWALLILRANIDVNGGAIRNSEQIYLKGKASLSLLSPESFTLTDSQIFVPAKSVLSQFTLPVTVTASGRFRVDLESLEMSPTCTSLMGKGAWLNARVDTPTQPVELGSFEANLSCDNGTLSVQVLPDNTLNLDAKISVDQDGKYTANGQFRPDAELPPVIRQAADSIFPKNPQGFYILRL